jgi:hypothetical protein
VFVEAKQIEQLEHDWSGCGASGRNDVVGNARMFCRVLKFGFPVEGHILGVEHEPLEKVGQNGKALKLGKDGGDGSAV